MKSTIILRHIVCGLALLFLASPTYSNTPTSIGDILSTTGKEDMTYASFGYAMTEFRSVNLFLSEFEVRDNGSIRERVVDVKPYLTAHPYSIYANLGTYITDYFKTELRAATGVRSDTLKGQLELNFKYVLSWYIGATYPLTDYMSVYGMYGISHFATDITRSERDIIVLSDNGVTTEQVRAIPSKTRMEEKLLGTSFSPSWVMAVDFRLSRNVYWAFEYGRLVRDSDTGIQVRQATTSLRYEF